MKKNQKRKIVLVCPRTPRLYSTGLENLTVQLARYFSNAGLEVEIFTTTPQKTQSVDWQGLTIREFSAFSPKESYFFSIELFSALKKSDADFVLVNGYNNLPTLFAMLAKKKNQKLAIYVNASGAHSRFKKFLRSFFDRLIRFFNSRIDYVFYSSDSESEQYRHLFGKVPSEIIGLGIDRKRIESVKVEKIPGRLLCVGRLVKSKGFLDLLPAFAIVAKQNPKVQLVIIGDGPDREEFVALAQKLAISSKVEFKGAMTDRDAYLKELKCSSALILLLGFRAVSLVLLEGLAAQIPVIVNQGASPAFAQKKYVVEIKNQKDPVKTAEVIAKVLKNPQQFVPKNPEVFTWEEIGERIKNVLESAKK
ncbi:MAG: glycosyltransferase family 4 protein [Candidatus Micrarchaeota archaeon]